MLCPESGTWNASEQGAKYSSACSRQTPQVRHGTELLRGLVTSLGRDVIVDAHLRQLRKRTVHCPTQAVGHVASSPCSGTVALENAVVDERVLGRAKKPA